jgi:hypothetical protein
MSFGAATTILGRLGVALDGSLTGAWRFDGRFRDLPLLAAVEWSLCCMQALVRVVRARLAIRLAVREPEVVADR